MSRTPPARLKELQALSLWLLCLGVPIAVAEPGVGGEVSNSAAPASANVIAGTDSGRPSSVTTPLTNFTAALPTADEVVVHKAERRLYLMRHGEVLRSYRIALGLRPDGPKERAGDFRTPEGRYLLTRRNTRSDYFLSIQVSYPNEQDQQRAKRSHADPGGSIMLHGLPNTLHHSPDYYAQADWTDGCIAMSDSDMVELWLMTRDNTPIEILP